MADLFETDEVPVTDGQYVCLNSGDGHQFYVSRKCAISSNTIKEMLSGPGQWAENAENSINFRDIPSHILQRICVYFYYKQRYHNANVEIPEFPLNERTVLDLLMAANFLDT